MVVDQRLTEALREAERLLDRGEWVSIRARGQEVLLHHGAVLSNHEREAAIATIVFFPDGSTQKWVHP